MTLSADVTTSVEPTSSNSPQITIFRLVAVFTIIVGLNYIIWRYGFSLNLNALWFAIPLVLAETYSFIDSLLFGFMMWKPTRRVSPEPIEASVDVFITTYNEPPDLVRITAEAAVKIDWAEMSVYILDDGARSEVKQIAEELGCGYITRGEEWQGKQRHAKAGNVNNALMGTSGEFILILDADQIPSPQIIHRCIGYFCDDRLAFVQTPQSFYNLLPGDPFGSDAPLFYGPILKGKDGWNAAFFCGSNAILRREALMQLGLSEYVKEVERQMNHGLIEIEKELSRVTRSENKHLPAFEKLQTQIQLAHQQMKSGQSLERTSEIVKQAISDTQLEISREDIDSISSSLLEIAALGDKQAGQISEFLLKEKNTLGEKLKTSPESLGIPKQVIQDLNLVRANEAQPVLPLATISITEDMATAMRLHAAGWKSVFHPEILAYGLAPEDLGSALSQRLRWAQGTIQVMVRENPLTKKGLSLPQRISYFTTIYSYFSGFFNLIFLLAPIIYLFTGTAPVSAWSWEFMFRLIPFLILNKIMFRMASQKIDVFRGEQYNLGLFSLWIQAVVSVISRKKLGFVVTPKQRQTGNYLRLVWPQITVILLNVISIAYCLWALSMGKEYQLAGVLINIFWGVYNSILLSGIIRAAVYNPPAGWHASLPTYTQKPA